MNPWNLVYLVWLWPLYFMCKPDTGSGEGRMSDAMGIFVAIAFASVVTLARAIAGHI